MTTETKPRPRPTKNGSAGPNTTTLHHLAKHTTEVASQGQTRLWRSTKHLLPAPSLTRTRTRTTLQQTPTALALQHYNTTKHH